MAPLQHALLVLAMCARGAVASSTWLPGQKTVMIWCDVSANQTECAEPFAAPLPHLPQCAAAAAAPAAATSAAPWSTAASVPPNVLFFWCIAAPARSNDDYGAYLKQNIDAITAISPTIWHLAPDGVSLTASDATMAAAAKLKKQSGVRVLPTVFDNESYNQGTLKPRLLKLFAQPEKFIAAIVNASLVYDFDGVNLVRRWIRAAQWRCAYFVAVITSACPVHPRRISSHGGGPPHRIAPGCWASWTSSQLQCTYTGRSSPSTLRRASTPRGRA